MAQRICEAEITRRRLQPKEIVPDRRRRAPRTGRRAARSCCGAPATIVVTAMSAPFARVRDFFYLTGVELPNAISCCGPGDGGDSLFLPPRDPNVERWTGPKWGPGEETADRTRLRRGAVDPTDRRSCSMRADDRCRASKGGSRAGSPNPMPCCGPSYLQSAAARSCRRPTASSRVCATGCRPSRSGTSTST